MKERLLNERDFFIGTVLKAELMLSDYTLADDKEDELICTELLERYIVDMNYPKATFVFNQFCQATDKKSREVYIDILFDVLANYKAENNIELKAWTEHTAAEPLIAI